MDSNSDSSRPDTQGNLHPPMPRMRDSDEPTPLWRLCRFVSRGFFIYAFRGRMLGRENVPEKGGALIVSTHQSYFDPVLASLGFDRETSFMARESLFVNHDFAWLIRSLNAYPVSRNTTDMRAVKETLRRLKSGKKVLVFPEGTRTPDGRIGKLQPGVAAIAKQANVTVVPTLIEGACDVLPRQASFPRLARIIVKFAPPITPEEVKAAGKQELLEQIDRTLREMQSEVRRIYNLPPWPEAKNTSVGTSVRPREISAVVGSSGT